MEIKIGQKLTTDEAMKLAIEEAYKGATRVSPNPLVGCVVLDSVGGFLAKGHHEFYGGPHAEVNALKGLSPQQLQGAHVIVTLEPCAHEGKTPSCAKMLAQLPVAKVTFGLVDPNPLVAGQGAQILRDVGIQAEVFESQNQGIKDELELVCESFLWNFRNKRPFVAVKVATSLDGQIALQNGESQWITGPASREYVHYLRACYDAILVGRGTVVADNPSLNIRHPEFQKENKVVILDSEGSVLDTLKESKIFATHKPQDIFVCVADQHHAQSLKKSELLGVNIIALKSNILGGLDLDQLLVELYKNGIKSIFVEGGAQTASNFVAEGKVNRVYVFQAPILMGSGFGRSWTETLKIESMQNRLTLKYVKNKAFGPDLMWTGRLN